MTSQPPFLRIWHLVVIVLVVGCVGAGGWYALARGAKGFGLSGSHEEPKPTQPILVEVVHPQSGGIERVSKQPGTIEPYEVADLYAKASGFLIAQSVDIGSVVKKGEILAWISVPEYQKQVERDEARETAADARVRQMIAHKTVAEADARAAEASVAFAEVMVRARTAYRHYREKQLERVKELVAKRVLDDRLRDEQEDYYLSALEGENAALEQVNTAKEKAGAARAKILQALADVESASADVKVAQAELEKSRVLLGYTIITSPYDGVVTKRNFHPGSDGQPGAFIKAADQGGVIPLLTVERTDVMRVVVQVPDRDATLISTDTTVRLEVDALPGMVFDTVTATSKGKLTEKLKVARWAKAQDPLTRTMRTEVDVINRYDGRHPNGLLKNGMYGHVTLVLDEGTPNAIRIPSAALVKAENRQGSVRIVQGKNMVQVVPVQYVTDNGVEVEITAGLQLTDQVIVWSSAPVEEGSTVSTRQAREH